MSTAINYDDVLDQLAAAGLLVHGRRGTDSLEIGRLRRCWVEGDSEKRGWYALHEVRLKGGDMAIVGAFGVWRGAENNKQQIEIKSIPLSAEQRGRDPRADPRRPKARRGRPQKKKASAAARPGDVDEVPAEWRIGVSGREGREGL
ncbi:MAG: hypothetical protein MZW92_31725 [Comamonadaceae bacterium]|nr:hypothetical protein [Comamonadaceae bacterium]